MRLLSLCDRPAFGERGRDAQSMTRNLLSVQGDAWCLVTAMIFPACLEKAIIRQRVVVNPGEGSMIRARVPFTWCLVG